MSMFLTSTCVFLHDHFQFTYQLKPLTFGCEHKFKFITGNLKFFAIVLYLQATNSGARVSKLENIEFILCLCILRVLGVCVDGGKGNQRNFIE